MHFPRPQGARFTTAVKASIFIVTLSATTLLPMLSNPNTIRADASCSPNGAFLSGTNPSWLNGTAVNVCNNGGVSTNDYGPSCFTKSGGPGGAGCPSGTIYAGEEWQCVELVNRLYLAKGWISGTWSGNGNTLINNLPANLTDQLNGYISYVNSGDVITLDDGGFGHAAIVNTIGSNSSLNIVNQNTTQSNLYSSATLSTGTSLSAGNAFYNSSWFSYRVQAIVHHPATITSNGTVYFIKTTNTSSGKVELHTATQSSNYQSGTDATTRFSPTDASNGWFQMVYQDMYFIKTKNTSSGHVEVHTATALSGYNSGSDVSTALYSSDANNGWFQITTSGDLVFIKTTNTSSGHVELFRLTASSGYQTFATATSTPLYPSDASNGWFQTQGLDLVFIKTKNTSSGKVEYFRVSANSGYQTITVSSTTAFSPSDANNGWFSAEDVNGDGNADVAFVKTTNTSSGHVEVFFADGTGFQTINVSVASWLSSSDANNGWFLIDSKD